MYLIQVSMVAAVAENNVIGAENDMPWRLSTDLKRFKALTLGKPVIMGRKTFESIGKPLPGRLNIVISRQTGLSIDGVVLVANLDAALELAKREAFKKGENEIMITGGGEIYKQAMSFADKLYITHVHAKPSGDTLFPEIDAHSWRVTYEEETKEGEKDNAATVYRIYERLVP